MEAEKCEVLLEQAKIKPFFKNGDRLISNQVGGKSNC